MKSLLSLVLVNVLLTCSNAFTLHTLQPASTVTSAASTALSMSSATKTTSSEDGVAIVDNNNALLKRDRYVATNRFAVRNGREAKFEKRWATRKSRLATLDGFKYFHLMRRVQLNDDDGTCTYDGGLPGDDESSQGNYVSFTIWEKKSHFSAWRKGDAFKEAHGGTSITAFVSTMIGSAFVLRGPPRPAFYDGLLQQSAIPDEESQDDIVDGWRLVDADGINTLPTECFVACNQFYVPKENAYKFEQRWANRESKLKDCDGFISFTMLRRDASAKGHGTVEMDSNTEPTYVSTTIWKDRASFDKWRTSNAFKQAHGSGSSAANNNEDSKEAKPPTSSSAPPLWSKPPSPIFYEGTLVISSKDGA